MHGLSRIVRPQPSLAPPSGAQRGGFLFAAHPASPTVSSLRDE
jgi:hypothetical protein